MVRMHRSVVNQAARSRARLPMRRAASGWSRIQRIALRRPCGSCKIDDEAILAVGDEIDGPAAADGDGRLAEQHGVEARLLSARAQRSFPHRHDDEPGAGHRLTETLRRRGFDEDMLRYFDASEQIALSQGDPHRDIDVAHRLDERAIIAIRITAGEQVAVVADCVVVIVQRVVERHILQLPLRQAKRASEIFGLVAGPDDKAMHRASRQAECAAT